MQLGAARAAGLHTDQGPPLLVPGLFFALAPLSLGAAGVLLVLGDAIVSRWQSAAMAATHIGTLGLLMSVMMGALYQMLPVLAGARVPLPRLGHGVWIALVVGGSALVSAMFDRSALSFQLAIGGLGAALLMFIPTVSIALARAPSSTADGPRAEVYGMRVAVACLAIVGIYGLVMAFGWSRQQVPAQFQAFLAAHAVAGLLGWVGILLTSISTQIIPMFYLTKPFPTGPTRVALAVAALSTISATAAPLLGGSQLTVIYLAIPAAVVIWLFHPAISLNRLRHRRRKRTDLSVQFWQAGLCLGPVIFGSALVALMSDDPRWQLLTGWLVIFGWAGLIIVGMLTRIVPFLVWFHRFAPLIGHVTVPPMRQLLPAKRARPALIAHIIAVLCGAIGIGLQQQLLLRVAGVFLVFSAILLGYSLIKVVSYGPQDVSQGA